MSTVLLAVAPAARLAIGALVLALALAFAGARRLALVVLVLLLGLIAAGARLQPTELSP